MNNEILESTTSEILPAIRKAVGEIQTWTIERVEQHLARRREIITGMLKEGVDYGVVPGTQPPKLALRKPGIEKLGRFAHFFGMPPVYAKYETVLDESDPFKEWEFEYQDKKTKQIVKDKAKGFYRFRVRCDLYALGSNDFAGSAEGECCSMERGREKSLSNTIWQMAKKRANSQAVTSYTCTSDILTDEESIEESAKQTESTGTPSKKATKPSSNGSVFVFNKGKHQGEPITKVSRHYLEWIVENLDPGLWVTEAEKELVRRANTKKEVAEEATAEPEETSGDPIRDDVLKDIVQFEHDYAELVPNIKIDEIRSAYFGFTDIRQAEDDSLAGYLHNLTENIKKAKKSS